MIELVTKSQFLTDFRHCFKLNHKSTPAQINADLKDKQKWMNAHFQWRDCNLVDNEEGDSGPTLWSAEDKIDDWVTDLAGVNIETTNQR